MGAVHTDQGPSRKTELLVSGTIPMSNLLRGLAAQELSLEERILVVADIHNALSAERPYRAPILQQMVATVLNEIAGPKLDAEVVKALQATLREPFAA